MPLRCVLGGGGGTGGGWSRLECCVDIVWIRVVMIRSGGLPRDKVAVLQETTSLKLVFHDILYEYVPF